MQAYQHQFIDFLLQKNALCFGDFVLKSGRRSPYFFNAGNFNTGTDLALLGKFYATAIEASKLSCDVLFGPAYKGIPLVCATAIAYAAHYNKSMPYAFNRKESKAHGEKGALVGAPIEDKKIVVIDDVVTAGTAIQAAFDILCQHRAELVGVVIAFDRQERGSGKQPALQELAKNYAIPIISLINFTDLIEYLSTRKQYAENLKKMIFYQEQYTTAL